MPDRGGAARHVRSESCDSRPRHALACGKMITTQICDAFGLAWCSFLTDCIRLVRVHSPCPGAFALPGVFALPRSRLA
eukprot:1881000-Alexandrium_andersonii.AAC.1